MLAICQGVLHYVATTAPEDPEVIEPLLLLLVKFGKWVPWRPNYRSWRHCCWKIHANAGGKQYTLWLCYLLSSSWIPRKLPLCSLHENNGIFRVIFFFFLKNVAQTIQHAIFGWTIFLVCVIILIGLFCFYVADKIKR